ncbi:MAG: imidazolonepropionase [Planctomycetota bacterium]|nr:imidazolonepropionase [Planctomycetota bacterium]
MSPRTEREPVDLLVHGAAEVSTPTGSTPRTGRSLADIQVHRGAAVAVRGGRIVDVGDEADLRRRFVAARELDARGGTVVPGFVDAHTHPVFAGTREDEFEMRTRGATYLEIAAAGGGILSSVRGVRAATRADLVERVLTRLDRFLELGTTTIEAKSGYGLSIEDELKSLEVLAEARRRHVVEVVPTFLGAHDVPAEHRAHPAAYVDLVEREMLPRVAASGLAEYCDVFVEGHTFGIDASRRILERARSLGLSLRIHADQLSLLGGARLAAELGAHSADHLEFVDDAGADALAAAGVTAVLCPVVPLFLRLEREAPARRLIERGVPIALSTDFNPGSCYLQSLPQVLCWAALRYRMTAAEALTAATLNAACSLGRGKRLGTIERAKDADLVVLDVPNHLHLVYEHGRNAVRAVVKSGAVVLEREPAVHNLGAREARGSNGHAP